jgi:hypothetical protein
MALVVAFTEQGNDTDWRICKFQATLIDGIDVVYGNMRLLLHRCLCYIFNVLFMLAVVIMWTNSCNNVRRRL